MRITLLTSSMLIASAALAQAVELQPSELSDADVAIRVVSVGDTASGSRIATEVANRTNEAETAQIECSLFGAGDAPLGTETAYAERIPSKGRVVQDISTKLAGISRVLCRIVDIQAAR